MKFLVVFLALLLFAGCSVRENGASSQSKPEHRLPDSEEKSSTASIENSPESSGNSEPLPAVHPDTEKYYSYFESHGYVGMLLEDDADLSDDEMAAYALSLLIAESDGAYDQQTGFPKEDFDAATLKYFGVVLKDYENSKSTVLSETGNITATGWGGNSLYLVLKELREDSDGIRTGVFYSFNFGMDGTPATAKDDLLHGEFEGYFQPSLLTLIFEEKTDDSGEMYLLYHSAKREMNIAPPYAVYNG